MTRQNEAPSLQAVCQVEVLLGDPRDLGVTRDGHRRITSILGGTLRGLAGTEFEGVRGEVLPGGSDRQLWREAPGETSIEIDARYDAQLVSGASVSLHATGLRRANEAGVYFMVQLRFETSAPEFAGAQQALFVADGVRDADRVRHTVYRVGSPI